MSSVAGSDAPDSAKDVYLVVRTRSVFACFLHWVLFLSVVTLTLTGLYIGYPMFYYGQGEAVNAFAMANVRTWHMYAAWALCFSIFTRMYLAFTDSCNHDIKQFLPTPKNVVAALKLAKYFVTLRGPHAHYRYVNPLGGVGIFTMAILFLAQVVTGLALYMAGANLQTWWFIAWIQPAVENVLGGGQGVRLTHHMVLYLLMFVVIIHIYMQIWKGSMFTESDMSSIISGYKVFPVSLIGHFDDTYGTDINEAPPSKEEQKRGSKTTIEATYK